MNRIYDKAIIFLITAICLSNAYFNAATVAVLLISLIASMISQCTGAPRVSYAVQTGYVLLCFAEPIFCMGLPLTAYEMVREKQRLLYLPAVLALILSITKIQIGAMFFCLAGLATALLIERRTEKLESAQKKLIEVRDNSAELNMLLTEKNRHLIESQDNEIYTATLKERNRIAREIHDNVGHLLTRSLLQMGALIVLTQDEEQKKNLQRVQDTLNSAMNNVRQSVHDLHDDSINLEQTVREISKSIADKFSVTVEYDCGDGMPNNVKLAFIGIAKEGLNNAAKYSNGDYVLISIQEFPAFYRLIVFDNGENPYETDIESKEKKSSGIGLTNMRDRADGLNGIIRISSSKKGFKVFVTVPKPPELCTV